MSVSAEDLNTRAVSLHRAGRFDEALAAYRSALDIAPDFVEAHNNVGTLLGTIGRAREAIPHFERAISLRPHLAAAFCNLSVALYMLGRLEEAEEQYRRALAIEPENAVALGHLAEILIELGRLDEARDLLAFALQVSPRSGWLFRRWAEIKPVRSDDRPLAAMEASLANLSQLSPDDRIQLHYALGKAYDDTGRYADAFRHIRAANQLRRPFVEYDEAESLASIERVRSAFTRKLMRAKSGAGEPSPVPIFIVGMPRSGTTLVEQILAAVPSAFGAGELGDFERVLAETLGISTFAESIAQTPKRTLNRLGRAYVKTVRALAPSAARITDKTLANFQFVGLIHLALPNARIVHVARDAVDTCLSCYTQFFREGLAYSYDLEELGRYYRAYLSLMQHWHDVLPSGVMLDVSYEDLIRDFEREARRIVGHCGLDWNDGCFEFHATARPVRTASAAQVRRPLYATSVGRRNHYRDHLGPLLHALAGAEEPGSLLRGSGPR